MKFFLGLLFIVACVHAYLWLRLVRDTRLPPRVARLATCLLVGMFFAIPATLLLWHSHTHSAPALVLSAGFGWLGVTFYLFALVGSLDLLRSLFRSGTWLMELGKRREHAQPASVRGAGAWSAPVSDAPARHVAASLASASDAASLASASDALMGYAAAAAPPVDASQIAARPEPSPAEHSPGHTRRVFVARALAGTAVAASGGIAAWGVRSACWDITMPEVPVRLERLPKALDGYTIALLTDIHIGPLLHGHFLQHLAEKTSRARPDMIAICGDLVDGTVAQIGDQVASLRYMRARQGVYFVTGNHEYYSGAADWCDFLTKLGVRVLTNERVSLGDAAASGAQFDLAGMPDYRAGMVGGVAPNARAATHGRDEQRELVMLAHQPIQIDQSASVGAGLQLSGHTHGGQLFPFGAAVAAFAQPYLAGLHRHEDTSTQVYVSRGTGFWGPPMRVLAPAEITLLRLHSA